MPENSSRSRLPSDQPTGLFILSIAEACERAGFYLLLALLTLYLNERLGMTEAESSRWYGNYMSAAYLAAFFGGWAAGRWGQRRQWIVFGAVLLAVGYGLLGLGRSWLAVSVVVLVLGNAFFKPNISALIGALYPSGDSRGGYQVFYFAINLGGFAGPLVGEWVRGRYGFTGAFAVAAAALVLSNLVLLAGWKHLPATTSAHAVEVDGERKLSRALTILLICSVALVPFWAVFQQNGSALTFWARDNTNRQFLGHEIPPGSYNAVNPLIICALGAPVAYAFSLLQRRGIRLTSGTKILLGVLFCAAGCATMYLASRLGGDTGRVSQWWLIGCYVWQSVGELCLSPVGLAMVASIAPPRHTGLLMGVWFAITALGNKLAGVAGSQWMTVSHSSFFAFATIALLGSAMVLLIFLPWLNKRMPPEVE